MQGTKARRIRALAAVAATTALTMLGGGAGKAHATPVCTDDFMGGPPAAQCGGLIFPEPR